MNEATPQPARGDYPPPGLYPDPQGTGFLRHWTGFEWGTLTNEPVVSAPPPTAQATHQYFQSGPPTPPRKRRVWPWVLGGVGLAFVLGVGGCAALIAGGSKAVNDAVEEQERRDQEAFNEVQLAGDGNGCTVSEAGWMQAFGTITNGSSKTSNYLFEVRFVDDGGVQLATGLGAVNNVLPGSTANWESLSFQQPPADGNFRCEIADVKRFAS